MAELGNVSDAVKSSKPEGISLPGMDGVAKASNMDLSGFALRYLKVDLDDPAGLMQLEDLETKGLEGKDTVILARDKFTFMDKYFLVLTYLQKKPE